MLVPAWPRYLAILQLVVVYQSAGLQKVSAFWLPGGELSALYYVLNQVSWARWELPGLWVTLYPLTQAATLVTWCFEVGAFLLLLALYFRDTRTRKGRLRAIFNRLSFRTLYLGIGALFHLGTAFSLQLGIFPFAVLAIYPACFHPDELARGLNRLVKRR